MSNSLTLWSAAKEVSSAALTVVNTFKTLRAVRKNELAKLDLKIKAATAQARIAMEGNLIRENIMQIAQTQRLIDQLSLHGIALEMAMNQLRRLGVELENIILQYGA